MKKTFVTIAAVLLLAAALVIGFRLYISWKAPEGPVPSVTRREKPTTGESRIIDLYFSDADGRRLALEAREIPWGETAATVLWSVQELISGPGKRNLSATIPGGVKVRSVFVRDRIAYVDLTSAVSSNHPGGSWSELLTVYSLVNTITENFTEIDKVQLLIEGKESETLAGHIDINRPLPGRIQLLAGDW